MPDRRLILKITLINFYRGCAVNDPEAFPTNEPIIDCCPTTNITLRVPILGIKLINTKFSVIRLLIPVKYGVLIPSAAAAATGG